MSDLNQWSGIGRLGRDVELRVTPAGDSIANFSIGCGWKTKSKEGTEWVNVSAFGKLAEICGQYLTKGGQVFVQGKMKTEKYEDKNGVTKYSTKIAADTVQFLSKGKEADITVKYDSRNVAATKAPTDLYATPFDDMPDDLPF
jgi:single-strand DNA-binding protein